MIEVCFQLYTNAWSAYLQIYNFLTFLAFLAYLTYLIFADFLWLNWILLAALLIGLSIIWLCSWVLKTAMLGVFRLLKVQPVRQTQISLIFCLLFMIFWGFAPRVAVFYIGWNFEIIPCFLFAFPCVALIIQRHFYTCKDFVILYSENDVTVFCMCILNVTLLIVSCRLGTAYHHAPSDIATVVVCQVVCTPLCTLATLDAVMLMSGEVRITVVREHQMNQVAPMVQEMVHMERKERLSFECKICFEEYSESRIPKSLSNCDHTICEECATNCLKLESGRFIVCPICQQVTVVKGGIAALSTNLVLMEVMDEVKKNE